jgi:hypothetical protein
MKLVDDLTPEERQFVNDEAWKYAAYSVDDVSMTGLLEQVTATFDAVPSYAERFKDGREQFSECVNE